MASSNGLSPQSQCLLRQKDLFENGRWLLVNPTDALVFNELPDTVFGFHQYYDQYLMACNGQAERHSFGITLSSEDSFEGMSYDGIVLYLPKAKKHTVWLLKHLASLLNRDGLLCIVGENKGGIKSSGKLLEAVGNNANKIESARHCSVYASVVSEKPDFNLNSYLAWFDVEVNQQALKLASLPGVFSHGELDAGTQLLLENVHKVRDGKALDFACGNGVIGSYLKKLNPKIDLTMSDVSALAMHCSGKTVESAHLVASNGLKQIDGKFQAIYTNPPFHTGISNDYSITQQFIADAAAKLTSGGELWLVANQFLPYPEHLKRHFGGFTRAAETSKFTLYHCIKS